MRVSDVCLDGALSVNSNCPYCHAVIVDLVAIAELPEVNRSNVLKNRATTEPLKSSLHQNGIPSALATAWNDHTHGAKTPPENLLGLKTPPEQIALANTDANMPPENMLPETNAQTLTSNDLGRLQEKNLDKTPLQNADVHRSDSQERKRKAQLKQAARMMKQQGSHVAASGAAPGAVVTVKGGSPRS